MRCELHGEKFGKRLINFIGSVRISSLIAFEIMIRKERADIETCDIVGAESTPTLTLKLPSESHYTQSGCWQCLQL